MALINCPECGKEISDQSKTCIHCGYPLQNSTPIITNANNKKKSTKLGIIIVAGTILLAILGTVVGITTLLNPQRQLNNAIKNNDFHKVVDLYIENYGNDEFEDMAINSISEKTVEIFVACSEGTYHINTAIQELLVLSEIFPTEIIIDELTAIQDSKTAFQAAEEYINKEEYLLALDAYSRVITSDVENYDTAQSQLEICKQGVYDTALRLIDLAGYEQALNTFQYISSYKDSATHIATLKQYDKLYNLGVAEVKNSFESAYEYFKQLPDNYPDKSGYLALCKQYIPYCGDLIWTEGFTPVFDSDFYIEDNQLFWTYGWIANDVFINWLDSGVNNMRKNMPSSIYANIMGGGWFLSDFEIKNSKYVNQTPTLGALSITFQDGQIVIICDDTTCIFVPYAK